MWQSLLDVILARPVVRYPDTLHNTLPATSYLMVTIVKYICFSSYLCSVQSGNSNTLHKHSASYKLAHTGYCHFLQKILVLLGILNFEFSYIFYILSFLTYFIPHNDLLKFDLALFYSEEGGRGGGGMAGRFVLNIQYLHIRVHLFL